MKQSIKNFGKMFLHIRKHRRKHNLISYRKCAFWKNKFKFNGNSNRIMAEDSLFYKCRFFFLGSNNKIIIEKGCKFKNVTFCIEGDNNVIRFGDHCSFCGRTEISCLEGTTITFGNKVLSSSDIFIRTSDSHSICDLSGKRINHAKDIAIGNNVWLCQKVSILKGSTIPNNSIVAYGAIVTKPFDEEYCVIGGNPAKIIKKNVQWVGGLL